MRDIIPNALIRATRRLAAPYIWTHPHIAETFGPRPAYQASFKKAWLSFLWGGDIRARRLRESIAVAVSVANRCSY